MIFQTVDFIPLSTVTDGKYWLVTKSQIQLASQHEFFKKTQKDSMEIEKNVHIQRNMFFLSHINVSVNDTNLTLSHHNMKFVGNSV